MIACTRRASQFKYLAATAFEKVWKVFAKGVGVELELYGASSVDFIMPEFWDVHGEKAELEVYCAKEAFDRACAGADSPNDD